MNQCMQNYLFYCWCIFFSLYLQAAVEKKTACHQILQNPKISDIEFSRFRSNSVIIENIDNITYEMGIKYADWLKTKTDGVNKTEECRLNDSVGEPLIFSYDSMGLFSPTTLRYMNLAYEIKSEFGDLSHMHILEIGGGYGGLCRILGVLGGFASYTIVDASEYHELANFYLNQLGIIDHVKFFDHKDLGQVSSQNYDLVISNYTFSQFEQEKQDAYINRLLKHIPNGFLCYDFRSAIPSEQKKELDSLISVLLKQGKQGTARAENPTLHVSNVLLSWKNPTNAEIPPYHQPSLVPTQFQNAITYSFSGGRLGDNLLAYLHAKWMSYKFGLPLIYVPFPQSDQFLLHYLEQKEDQPFNFCHRKTLTNTQELDSNPQSICWTIPYFPEFLYEYNHLGFYHLPIKVDWNDPSFKAIIKKYLSPYPPIPPFPFLLPKDRLTVAVHVRRSKDTDPINVDTIFPLKFLPDSYYIEQIRRLANLYHDQQLCIFIFTDEPYPKEILNTYEQVLQNPRIMLMCRTEDNSPYSNILEDFYGLTQFDCLIRSSSNFSLVAAKIANYQIEIGPTHYHWENGAVIIDNVELNFNR